MSGYEYGNTRVRARHARLLDAPAYAGLLRSPDIERLAGTLAVGTYRPDVERAIPRFAGVRLIDASLAFHLEREMAEVRSFYDEEVSGRLGVMLGRWDVANLVGVLRAQAARRRAPAAGFAPTGRVSRAVLDEIAAQPGLRPAAELIVSWGIPTPAARTHMRSALVEFDRSGVPASLEVGVAAGFVDEVTRMADAHPDRLSAQLVTELTANAIVSAARIRAASLAGEPPPDPVYLSAAPGVAHALIEAVAEGNAEAVSATTAPEVLRPALASWFEHGDAVAFADELARALLRLAVRAYASDPLGVGVPTGYLWSLEAEARNLRLIARCVDVGLPPEEMEGRMMLPWPHQPAAV